MFGKVLFTAVIAMSIASTGCASSTKSVENANSQTVNVQPKTVAQLDGSLTGETTETAGLEDTDTPANVTQTSKKKEAKSKKKKGKKGNRKRSDG